MNGVDITQRIYSMLTSPDKPKLTDEGVAIIDHLRTTGDNISIEALAGCGKTTVMQFMAEASPQQPCLYIAFAKSDVTEAEKRFPSTTKVKTINGLGHGIWSQAVGKVAVSVTKMKDLMKEELNALKGEDRKEVSEAYLDILSAASMAKHIGYIPDGKFPHARRLCNQDVLGSRIETR